MGAGNCRAGVPLADEACRSPFWRVRLRRILSSPLILQALLVGDLADELERERLQFLRHTRRVAEQQL